MIDKICENLTDKIRKDNPEIDDEKAEIIDYGIHLIFGEIPKFFIIMGIAYLLGVFKLTLLTYLLLMPFRGTSGGFHLKTHIGCIIGTTIFYSGTVLLSKYLVLGITVKYIVTFIIWLFGLIMVTLYAPADTENVPIIGKKERRNKKVLSYITLTLSIVASIFIKDVTISNILMYGMLLQSISISRFAYKLTNNKYGYEMYNVSENLV